MLDEKKIKELQGRVANFIRDDVIKKGKENRYVTFFLNNAKNSLDAAKLLSKVSIDIDLKKTLGFPSFNGSLWVINSSYYSMFYMARALLESECIRIKTNLSIHSITFDALIHYFYLSGKLQKRFIEDLAEAREDAAEILGQEKAKEIIEDYFFEKRKRGNFTYEMGLVAMENKANTSLERAKRFNEEIRKMLEA